jgi:hypothetical protein
MMEGYDKSLIINDIYMFYSVFHIKALANFSLDVYTIYNGASIDTLLIQARVDSTHQDVLASLNLEFEIKPVEFDVTESNGAVSLSRKNDNPRCQIINWYISQEPMDVQEIPVGERWDGVIAD